jgi:hypothetical protein
MPDWLMITLGFIWILSASYFMFFLIKGFFSIRTKRFDKDGK